MSCSIGPADYYILDNIQNDVDWCRCRRPKQAIVVSIDVVSRSTQFLAWTLVAAMKGCGCKLCALGRYQDEFMRGQDVVWEGKKTEGSQRGGGTGAFSRSGSFARHVFLHTVSICCGCPVGSPAVMLGHA